MARLPLMLRSGNSLLKLPLLMQRQSLSERLPCSVLAELPELKQQVPLSFQLMMLLQLMLPHLNSADLKTLQLSLAAQSAQK